MAHQAVPPQDWDATWNDFVTEPWAKRDDPNPINRGFAYPMAAGGVGAYGMLKAMDWLARWMVDKHLATYEPGTGRYRNKETR